MADGGLGGIGQPGARTTRQETIKTEVWMPLAQALLRAVVDVGAALLAVGCLLILGRWVMWAVIGALLFSESYQVRAARLVARLMIPAQTVVTALLWTLQWLWVLGGGLVLLSVVVPVTWTWNAVMLQTADLALAWPPVVWRDPVLQMGFSPFGRAVALLCLAVPLFTWQHLRDRLAWSLMEFTPFAPVPPEMGIDPRRWRKEPETPVVRGAGVVIERVDWEPDEREIGRGVAISNGAGNHLKHIDLSWVTEEQWQAVAQRLLVLGLPFTEQNFGRGIVFPTHGPKGPRGEALGFRTFRQQLLEAGLVTHRGTHPNEGYVLTIAGEEKLGKWLGDPDYGPSVSRSVMRR